MRRVGAQVIFYRLVIAYVEENVIHQPYVGVFVDRRQKSALKHVLYYCYGLERHRLSAGIRSRDNEYAPFGTECQIQRHDFLALAFKCHGKYGVAGMVELKLGRVGQMRHVRVRHFGESGFGADEIECAEDAESVCDFVEAGTETVGQCRQYADDLASFFDAKFAQAVVGLNHFGRLYVECLSRGRFVVNYTLYLALVHRCDRDYQAPFAHRRSGIGFKIALAGGCGHDPAHGGIDSAGHGIEFSAYLGQSRRCAVLDFAMAVYHSVYGRGNFGKRRQALGQIIERRVGSVAFVVAQTLEKCRHLTHGGDARAECRQFLFAYVGAGNAYLGHQAPQVVDASEREFVVGGEDMQHLVAFGKPPAHFRDVGAESHFVAAAVA